MTELQTQQNTFPFYQFCLARPTHNFLKCTNSVFLGVLILIMIGILLLQLKRRFQMGTKKKSRKCIILYMIIANFIILFIDSVIVSNKYIIELEPYFRTIVFIYVYYYISLKLSRLSVHRKRARRQYQNVAIGFYIVVTIGLVFILIELIKEEDIYHQCYFKYGKISRIVCGIVTGIIVIISIKLQRKMDNKAQLLYQDHALLQMKTFQHNETQREDLRMLIVMYCASQFLTIVQMIYFLVRQSMGIEIQFPNCTPCQMIPCLQWSENTTIALEIATRLFYSFIIIILPYLALIYFFWINPQKIQKFDRTISKEEDAWENYFKKLGNEKSKLAPSDTSEIQQEKNITQSLDLSK